MPKRICATHQPAQNNTGMASWRKDSARYVSNSLSTKPIASIQGIITSETTLKISHRFSHFHERTNFIGNMQVPDMRPETVVLETPASRGCPISQPCPKSI